MSFYEAFMFQAVQAWLAQHQKDQARIDRIKPELIVLHDLIEALVPESAHNLPHERQAAVQSLLEAPTQGEPASAEPTQPAETTVEEAAI